jgi:hypothetical protein
MATANLMNAKQSVADGIDNVVIVNYFDGIRGGRTLDVTGFAPEAIHAGHVIIKLKSGEYAPMPLNGSANAYATLPEGASYAGFLVASIPTKKPFAAIMVRGTINPKAAPFSMDAIMAALKEALPLVDYQED